MLGSIDQIQQTLRQNDYVADRQLATTLFLAASLRKPVLLEGEAGVGKTEVAKVLADILETRLIRLQCYEGLDASHALYEWNYARQMLRIRMEEGQTTRDVEDTIFTEDYLIKRPLLEAIMADKAPVLLIDEIDRADEEFEAFLLEVLSDFQITIPEMGTIRAKERPFVVLTSNRTREINDALKRRCLYLWIPYPTWERELEIVKARIPGIDETLAEQICSFMQRVRGLDLFKRPGVAESLDWATALVVMDRDELDPETVEATLGCIFKYHEDVQKMTAQIPELVAVAKAGPPA